MAIEDVLFAHNVKNGGSVRSVNGRQGDVTITAEELGSAPAEHTHEISEVTGLQSSLELLDTTQEYITDMNRKSVVLSEGTHIVTSETSALADVEIEGRTLTSMANSNLEGSKYYTLADAKTKVIVDKKTVAGVGKFQKEQTTKTVADFSGKISGSTVANPHILMYARNANLINATSDNPEITNGGYSRVSTMDNDIQSYHTPVSLSEDVSNQKAQHLFSFNVVEQIERELGLIPRETLAEKVQWVKENILGIIINWYGFGTGPSGSGASLTHWNVDTGEWRTDLTRSHNNNSVAMLSRGGLTGSWITNEGITHHLAYAEPSDGVTPSVINTDYVKLEIELKSTAQLNTRGKIIRVENFEGKVAGNVVENPHVAKTGISSTAMETPTSDNFTEVYGTSSYDRLYKSNDSVASTPRTGEGIIAQQLFSFDLIESIERGVGKIPANDVAGKVSWLKYNVSDIRATWIGKGTSVSGSRANFSMWSSYSGGVWWTTSHSSSEVSPLSRSAFKYNNDTGVRLYAIDNAGFIHFLASAEPSDGVTTSVIYTDYIELEIELKPTADFRAPRVPLYEVTKDEYDKIGIVWDEAEVKRRYPVVEGTQHLVNPYVMAEGDNLLPPATMFGNPDEFEFIEPYKVKYMLNASKSGFVFVKANPNTKYTFTHTVENHSSNVAIMRLETRDEKGVVVTHHIPPYVNAGETREIVYTFTTSSNTVDVNLTLQRSGSGGSGEVYFSNWSLNLGEPKPFVPRNPSYLYVQETLGALGDEKDVLFKEDGKWKVQKVVKTIETTGNLDWALNTALSPTDSKQVFFTRLPDMPGSPLNQPPSNRLVKSDGSILVNSHHSGVLTYSDVFAYGNTGLTVNIGQKDTGFSDSYNPSGVDIKRYFNGWKYTDGTTWTSVTGNGQTATAQEALDTKPTDYTPYKLSYVLAEPVVEEVAAEGQIKVDGVTQLEVGSGIIVREKVAPASNSSTIGEYRISDRFVGSPTYLSQENDGIIAIYKNGVRDPNWVIETTTSAQGKQRAIIKEVDFDTDAEYTVTYKVLHKRNFTNAPTHTKLTYANSIRASFQDVVAQVEDTSTQVSVDSKFLLDMLVQLKAMRG